MNAGTVKVAKVAEVTKGERASPEGVARRTKFGSAADYIFCGFAADYKTRGAI